MAEVRVQERQGWHDDPFGRHDQRYFSHDAPTALVRTDGIEDRDEPQGGDPVPVASEPVIEPVPAFRPRLYEVRRHPIVGRVVLAVFLALFLAGLIGLSAQPYATLKLVLVVLVALAALVLIRSRQRAA